MKRTLLFIITFFMIIRLFGQGVDCGSADPFCTGTTYDFPASTGVTSPTYGTYPNYGCLCTMPNPAYYYMQIGTSGNLVIHISTTPAHDVDFICWGPFTSPTAGCVGGLTGNCTTCYSGCPNNTTDPAFYPSGNIVDCSYSANSTEDCYINNAITGQFYLLLITNYSDQVCNINFAQSNSGTPGAATTNCGILPTPVSNNGPLCEGDTLKLFAQAVDGASFSWSGPNGWSSYDQNPVIPNATAAMAAGTYTCIVLIGTQYSPEDSTVVTINPNPVVTAMSDTICTGGTATLTASGASTYVWTPSNSTANPYILSPTVTTNYSVIGTSAFGCKDTAYASVIVNPGPTITVNNATICEGGIATLTASGAATYLWSNSQIINPINVSPVITTTYTVTGTDVNNCIGNATSIVTVNARPSITLDTVGICQGKTAAMIAQGGSASCTYTWSNGGSGNPLMVSPSASMIIDVYVTDANNCKDTASAMITVHPIPVAAFTPVPTTTTLDNPNVVFTNLSTNSTIWLWNFGDVNSSNNTSGSFSPNHSFSEVGEFTVTLTVASPFGCTDQITGTVVIENPYAFYIPNAFKPSSNITDNMVFKPKGIGVDPSTYNMIIYDRWGKEIFSTTDINEGWNGKYHNTGDVVPCGVYVYFIRFTQLFGFDKEFTGSLFVLE